jgi:hypothetical protein
MGTELKLVFPDPTQEPLPAVSGLTSLHQTVPFSDTRFPLMELLSRPAGIGTRISASERPDLGRVAVMLGSAFECRLSPLTRPIHEATDLGTFG